MEMPVGVCTATDSNRFGGLKLTQLVKFLRKDVPLCGHPVDCDAFLDVNYYKSKKNNVAAVARLGWQESVLPDGVYLIHAIKPSRPSHCAIQKKGGKMWMVSRREDHVWHLASRLDRKHYLRASAQFIRGGVSANNALCCIKKNCYRPGVSGRDRFSDLWFPSPALSVARTGLGLERPCYFEGRQAGVVCV